MAALVSFYTGEDFNISNLSGSGLGFYNSNGFGTSIPVGEYQGRTFITDSLGVTQGPEVDNCKYNGASGVIVGQAGSGISLTSLPNYLSTFEIRFTNDSAVTTQNAKLYIYDRVNKNNDPSGVTVQCAEIVHPPTTQSPVGSGDSSWTNVHGSGSILSLVDSPGVSGFSPNGASTSSVEHSWFIAISPSPGSVGAKLFSAHLELEYL